MYMKYWAPGLFIIAKDSSGKKILTGVNLLLIGAR